MNNADNSSPELAVLLAGRLAVVGRLAASLEATRSVLFGHDAEAIARGAAHQAELCREWSRLEDQLRSAASRQPARLPGAARIGADSSDCRETRPTAELEADWQALARRIRYLTRVHCSLLRHVQRSLGILQRVIDSCAPTYLPASGWNEPRLDLRAGE
ncbi:MAG: hypothetical protein WBV46_22035 [Terriglobales bacterium]|jgi:hypothetical protein